MSLKKSFKKEKHPNDIHLFLDLDGVMADFDRHARENGKFADNGQMKWDELDFAWWSTMPPCDGAKAFYDAAKTMATAKFLTAPVLHEECFSGKAVWVRNFCDGNKWALNDLIICPSSDKSYLARPNHILIDDREKNIDEWVKAGGVGIHHKGDFVQTMRQLVQAIEKIENARAPGAVNPASAPKLR